MKTKLILTFTLTSLIYLSCEKNEVTPTEPFPTEIIGDWLLISEKQKLNNDLITEDDNGLSSDWSGKGLIPLVGNIEINQNKTININHFGVAGSTDGTWRYENETIIFLTEIEYAGTILKDTVQFRITIDASQRLVLENDEFLLKHKKLD